MGDSSGHENRSHRVKNWETIADRLSKAGWSWGCVSAVACNGRTIGSLTHIGKRFVCARRRKADCVRGTGIGSETGLRQRHELALVRSERVLEICSAKRRHDERTERKSPKTSQSFVHISVVAMRVRNPVQSFSTDSSSTDLDLFA
jgi:hypothetical protein